MPRKRNKMSSSAKNVSGSISAMDDESVNCSVVSMGGSGDAAPKYTKEGLTVCSEERIAEIERKIQQTCEEIKAVHGTLRLSLTEPQLKQIISLEKSSDLAGILDGSIFVGLKNDETKKLMTPGTIKRVRRSRSIERKPLPTIQESKRVLAKRSSSVGASPAPFQTPVYRSLVQKMMSANKYTVRKPCAEMNSGVSVERAMRPGEVAISTAGSPLFASRIPSVPEVNIPLKNGMIINIDPENPSRKIHIPPLDASTREKIKVLCEKLQKCLSE